MHILIAKTPEDFDRQAADVVCEAVARQPDLLLVLPTGNTPLGMFKELAARVQSGVVDFSRCTLAQLDEYAGIGPDDPRSLYLWLKRDFITPVGLPKSRVLRFDSRAADPEAEALRFERAIAAAGGIGLSVLGLGPNGHLGINEPGTPFAARTFLTKLSPESLVSNGRYWGGAENVPPTAYTLGLGTLSEARQTLLLVSGEAKAGILRQVVHGPIGPEVPATVLRQVERVTVLADQAAAACLGLG